MPSFAHVSLILAPDRSKLSKRHGATSVGQFREMGYLPKSMVNYLALLGWSDGTGNEFFTMDQLIENFSISRINKSGAMFDSTKLSVRRSSVCIMWVASSLKWAELEGFMDSGCTNQEGRAVPW
ncbi:hypothetical protein KSP40_PGU011930 [Platanthera guangdongensis]|uniref:Glutamyl/glutaminyl-tRNA synthetase class Ib catalytic domain-containing protein n=1 Tax=Platanthera guangdongensis TaxID=2320717 RepID=A0ABR2MLB3_9ASPA